MYKSKYFTMAEMTFSATAKAKGIDNTPTPSATERLKVLMNHLDKIREAFGRPIFINSGYRCRDLNKAVGGASNSQHMTGEAADLDTKGHNEELLQLIRTHFKFDQLIDEHHGAWVHISFKSSGNRQQFLKIS